MAALVAAGSLAVACSVLSVFVVSKRWAFIGEGIAHAGFGGAGTAWVLAIALPGMRWLEGGTAVYGISVVFCLAVAAIIANVTRRGRRGGRGAWAGGERAAEVDTVIGIFLVVSLAWGFIAYSLYFRATGHHPQQFAEYLGFEHLKGQLTGKFVALSVVSAAAVLAAVWATWKELLFYATDEQQAHASGVNTTLVHYGLIVLLAVVIIIGMKIMGTVLVVALLVLPGAIGLALGSSTRAVWSVSAVAGLVGATGGVMLSEWAPALPEGPAIVLVLFGLFCGTLGFSRLAGRAGSGAARGNL